MKILILRLSSLGDIILTQPVCAILQNRYPGCEISYVCKPEYKELVELFDPPVKVISYHKNFSFHLHLRKVRYDLLIDLHGKLASWLISIISIAKLKVVYNKQRRLRQQIVQGAVKTSIDSTVSLYASALHKLGIKDSWQNPILKIPPAAKSISIDDKRRIAIFPGATHFTKRYPPESWIKVINSKPEYDFTLFGGKGDLALNARILSQTKGNCSDQTARFGFGSLLTELNSFDLIISGDTGPMHLAATLGKAQIAIFGGTHPRLGFKPLNPNARIICLDLECQPCSLHGQDRCPLGHFQCMNGISGDRIVTEIDSII